MARVTFGVNIDIFHNEYLPNPEDWGWDSTIYYIPDDWRTITKTIPAHKSHLAIKTGKLSNITVVDISTMNAPDKIRQIIPSYTKDIYHVSSPNHSKQYYFEYEPKLHSIYNTRLGVSVLNNDRFAIMSGKEHSAWDRVPIAKMPKEMLRLLLKWQNEKEDIDMASYELLSILPVEWFVRDELLIKLAEALSSKYGTGMAIAILRRLCADKIGYVDQRRLRLLIDCRITSMEYKHITKEATANNTINTIDLNRLRLLVNSSRRTFTYAALKKHTRDIDEIAYDEWIAKYSCRRTVTKPTLSLQYVPGAMTKLTDLKAFDSKLTARKLLEMNPEYTVSIKNICKHCVQIHAKRCCAHSSRDSRCSARMVHNVTIC
jgi:hypothetical protein